MSNALDDDEALIAAISNGSALAIVLQPDHDFMGYDKPTYNETYDLPFVYRQGPAVAGVTRPGHLIVAPDQQLHIASFSYNNITPFYSIQFTSTVKSDSRDIVVKLNSVRHYAIRRFVARPAGRLVYHVVHADGDGSENAVQDHGLRQSIDRGAKFRMVLRLDKETVWSLPVDLAYDYFSEQRAEFRSEATVTSRHCIYPMAFQESLNDNPKLASALAQPQFSIDLRMPMGLTYVRAFSDGGRLDAEGELTGARQPFQEFSVYEAGA